MLEKVDDGLSILADLIIRTQMMRKSKMIIGMLLFCAMAFTTKAQMAGTYSVPATFSTLASAISSLNAVGVNGPVTILVDAGYTETAPVGGYTLTATGTSANPIIFQKNGVGANPLISAYAGGTGTPGTAFQDGVFRLIGSDYITFDGIDITDPNTTNPSTMEFGYGLFKASATNGSQNNTIKNCVITLNRINNATGSGPATDGSRGIDVVNSTSAAHTTALTITAATGANSNNKFYFNTIQNCNIGISIFGYADSSPFANADNSNDIGGNSTLTGNTIINFGGGAVTNPAAGIRTNNQFNLNIAYNNVNNTAGGGIAHGGTLRGIYVNAAATTNGANNTISSNSIAITSTATTSQLSAIECASGSAALATYSNNFTNNLIQNCTYTTATTAVFNGVLNSASTSSVFVTGNTISALTYSGTGTGVLIETGSPTYASASSNTITGIVRTGTSGNFRLIKTTSPTSFVANNNLIDGVSWTNVTSTGGVDGIFGTSSAVNVTVTNNIIRNISLPTTGTANGIRENGVSGNKIFQNNQIYSFTTTAGGAGGATFNGIFCTTGIIDISNNQIYNLNSTGTTGGTSGTVYGIQISGGTSSAIYKNRIYNLSSNSSNPVVNGMNINGGTTNNIYNNLIGSLTTPSANAGIPLAGINISGGTTSNIYYNSVYLNGSSSGALFGSAALYTSTTPNINLRNNIFVNLSTFNGAGISAAYRRTGTSLTTYSSTSNNNLFYAGTPSANNVIFYDGTTVQQTLGAFKTLVSPRDGSSITENPSFVSTTGSNANFLNINTATPTQIESGGSPVSGITDDFIGTTRNVSTPDIGAWEGNYIFADFTAPSISAAGFTSSQCALTGRSFTATISDVSGLASGALMPRVYYKVNAGAYTSTQGTLTAGTMTNGVWSFSMAYTAATSDIISYYIIAQDAAPANNITSNPSAGLVATDVNNVTTAPTTPFTYVVANSLGGVYTVGATGNYPTLTAAANAYNTSCLTGPVTFSLIDASYSTSETFPITFSVNADASTTNSLLVIPSAGVSPTITGSNAVAIIRLIGADYITFNGSNTGATSKDLYINNTNTGTSSSIIWIGSASTSNGATNNSVKNCNIKGNGAATTYGGIVSSSGVTIGGVAEFANNNNSYINNTVKGAVYGIAVVGPTGNETGTIIQANLIGSTITAEKIDLRGIAIFQQQNVSVLSNTVAGVNSAVTTPAASGIFVGGTQSVVVVDKNIISDIKKSGAWGASGISLSASTPSSAVLVSNNFIFDVASGGFSSGVGIDDNGYGIIASAGGGYNIYHNTINLNTNQTTGVTAPLNITSGVTTASAINVVDNIFCNSQTTNTRYSIYSGAANTVFGTINYNDYSNTGTNLGFINSTAQANLAAVQSSFGGNLNSVTVTPTFISATDLHMAPVAGNVSLDNTGTPLGSVTTDIDNQSRSGSTPDMGADEFTVPVCTSANGGVLSATTVTACAAQTISLSTSGASNGLTISYQWQVATVPGGPYTNVSGGTGATTLSYTSTPLIAGTYYYVLQATCANATLTGISNEATVTINPIPTITVAASASNICVPGGSSVTINAGGGTNYTWTPSAGLSATNVPVVNALPSTSTIYTVTGSNTFGCTSQTTAVINISQYPTLGASVPSPSIICLGGTSTLQAAATLTTYAVSSIPYSSVAIPGVGSTTLCNNGTAVVTLSSGSLDDGGWSNIPIPFSFGFMGSTYTTCAISTNGFVFLGTGNPSTFTGYANAFPSTTPARPVIGAVYADLDFDGVGSGSNIQYFTTGTSPNQKFVVNWSGQFWNNTGTVTTQAIIYESTNVIEVHTYTSTGTNQAVEGIQNAAGNGAFVVSGRNSTNWAITTPDAYRWTPHTLSYSWTPSTFLSSATVANPVASGVTSTTNYSVSVIGSNGCSTGTTQVLTVDIPTVAITGQNTVCVGSSVILTASGTNTYSWNTAATSSSISVSPSTNTTYSVVGTNTLSGCTATASAVISTFSVPVITITGTTAICNGNTTTLTASGANTFTWNTSAVSNTVSLNPSANTTYTVTGTDVNTCTNTAVQTVTVNALPTVAITGNSVICNGNTASLTASGATSYSWNTTATSSTISVNPTSNTSYTVTGTDANNCSNTAVQTVSVNSLPVVAITGNSIICSGASASLSASGATSYSWNTTATTSSISVSPTSNTSYTVTGTDANNCTNTAVQTVTVNSLPTVAITGNSVICSGGTTTLTASGATSYSWNTTATTNSITDNPTSNTSYTVTGTDANNCSNTAVQAVTVNSLPVVVITGTNAVCDGQSTTLTAGGANTYSWSNGATTSTIAPTFTASVSYTVTGTDVNNCVNTATQAVTVNPNPTVTVAGGAICPGGSFTLSPSGANTYTYAPSGPVVNPGATTSYSVTGTDALGCVSQSTAVAVVTVTNNLVVSVSGSSVICAGQTASLTAGGAATYSWNTGATTSTIAPSPTSNTSYTVTGSSGSCSNTAVVNVTVNALPTVSLAASVSSVCINGSTVTLTGSPAGGVYTGSNVAGNVFTPGSTAGTFTPVYSYTDGVTGCSNTATASILVDLCTGVNNLSSAFNNLKVYPNPNKGEFTIELDNGSDKHVEVTDLTGRVVASAKTGTEKMVININDYANGVYFVKIVSNKQVEVVKIIKQ